MESMYIYFIRHAQSEGNRQKVFQGWSNVSLSEIGKKQVIKLKEHLLHENLVFDRIYSSPLARAMETALALQSCVKTKEIIPIDGFKAINVGEWEGIAIETVKKQLRQEYWNWRNNPGIFCFPGGESIKDVLKRAKLSLLTTILDQNWEKGAYIAIVTHMVVIRALLIWLLQTNLTRFWDSNHKIPNTGLILFEAERLKHQNEKRYKFTKIPLKNNLFSPLE
ncbi:MAG: histidine phosphatase family protein [Candidatus Hermodarchaeota archaeon]